MKRANRGRNQVGASGIILFCAIGLFAILPLGLATFEVWRYVVARSQLQYICDAAALCATANLLKQSTESPNSQSNGGIAATERQAILSTASVFQRNTVLNKSLNNTSLLENSGKPAKADVEAGQTVLWVSLVNDKEEQVLPGQPGAKGVRVKALYGHQSFCGTYLGLGTLPITVSSEGGIPPIDLVLCFDVSASMDDGTAVTMVKRFWNGRQVAYYVPGAATGSLLNIVKPASDGTRVNAVGPENLSALSTAVNGSRLLFSESPGSSYKGLRALSGATRASEVGLPPGNYKSGLMPDPSQSTNLVTDVVTNLDGNAQFGGWNDPATGLQFPNVQTLVEAARGNLNSAAAMQQALVTGGRPAWLPATAPNPLYQQVYFTQANRIVQPMVGAKTAAIQILRALNKSTDLSSGLVSFADYIGTDSQSTWGTGSGATTYFIDSNWPAGGTAAYPLPLLPLNSAPPNQVGTINDCLRIDRWFCQPAFAQALPPPPPNIQTLVQLISSFVATGESNTSAALAEAIRELTDPARSRPDAEKIILLVSDGQPDLPGGGGGANSPAAQACYDQARIAARNGIKIIAIDVSTTNGAQQWQFLSQTATMTGGFCAAGSSPAQLNLALRNIVTQLVALR